MTMAKLFVFIVLAISNDWCMASSNSRNKRGSMQLISEAPVITPAQNDVTAQPGQNYTFTCTASVPVTWKYDDSIKSAYAKGNNKTWSDFNPSINHFSGKDGLFESAIELNAIDYTFVGFYYCVKNSSITSQISTMLKAKDASRIYLFVDDPVHPIVLSPRNLLFHTDLVIPCKPTSRKSSVQLEKQNTEYEYDELPVKKSRNETFEYNDYEGFKPNFNCSPAAFFICNSSDGKTRQFGAAHYSIVPFPLTPKIRSKTGGYGSVGGKLELSCSVEFSMAMLTNFDLKWFTPNYSAAIKENRVTIETLWSPNLGVIEHKFVKKLTLTDFDESKDVGRYVCFVQIGEKLIPEMAELNVVKATAEQKASENEFVRAKGDEIEFKVNFVDDDQPIFTWLNNSGKKIEWSQSDTERIAATKENQVAKLRIQNIQREDAGNYTFHSDNGHEKVWKTFTLSIAELPTPRLNFARMSAKDGENMKLKCEISGSPYSDVLITFTPCYQKDRCLDKKHNYGTKVLISATQTESNQTITASFSAKTGFVTCMAENSLGINRTTADIVLDDERDFFVENKITHSFGSASEYYDSLDCRVNTDQYDRNLEWYKNGERQTSEHYPGVSMSMGSGGNRNSLSMTWYSSWGSYKGSGKYVCKAKRRSDNTIEERVFWVNRTRRYDVYSDVSAGDSFRFECEIDTDSSAEIRWYKSYANRLDADNNEGIEFRENNKVLYIPNVKKENAATYLCLSTDSFGTTSIEKKLKVS